MKIREFTAALEKFAAPELQEEYDNVGLIVGNADWECGGVLCTLDVTPAVVAEAISRKCNLIVAHHPLIFRGLRSINGKNSVEQAVVECIKHDIAVYAAHTNFDNVLLGVNGRLADRLGLKNCKILSPKNKVLRRLITFAPNDQAGKVRQAVFDAGAGHIGKYSECSFNSIGTGTFKAGEGADPYVGAVGERHEEQETKIEIVYPAYLERQVVQALVSSHPYEEVAYDIFTMDNIHYGIGAGIIGQLEQPVSEESFLQTVKEQLGAKLIRHTALRGKPVQNVAVCGGAGASLIRKALVQGADFFLTGDVKYHDFFEAEGRMVVADGGHYETEQFTIDLFHDLLVQKFPTFAVLKTGVNTNPVQYFV